MSATPPDKTNTPEGLPVDDAAQMSAWQRSTGRKPTSTENPSRPVRGKVTHGIFANRICLHSRSHNRPPVCAPHTDSRATVHAPP
jgi:hypothetical protein